MVKRSKVAVVVVVDLCRRTRAVWVCRWRYLEALQWRRARRHVVVHWRAVRALRMLVWQRVLLRVLR